MATSRPSIILFSATSLGLTDFNNLRIIFNASEPGSNGISLDNLALSLWNPATGTLIDAKNLPVAINFPSTNPEDQERGLRLQARQRSGSC